MLSIACYKLFARCPLNTEVCHDLLLPARSSPRLSSKLVSSMSGSSADQLLSPAEHAPGAKRTTVGFIVIGDEILKGQVQDTNTNFLAKRLYGLGIRLQRVSVIGDEIATIVEEVQKFSRDFDYVLTSGGIGPTHDDVTFEAVAKAFGQKLTPRPELVEICRKVYKGDPATEMNTSKFKMSFAPEHAKLIYPISGRYPLINVNNVFVFPGVPQLFTRAFDNALSQIFPTVGDAGKFHYGELFLNQKEVFIADALNQVVDRFQNSVVIGSYPAWENPFYETKLTFHSEVSRSSVDDAMRDFKTIVAAPQHFVPFVAKPEVSAHDAVYELAQRDTVLGQEVASAIKIIEQTLDEYGNNPNRIGIAFNGGKDCTALLHLYHAVLQRRFFSDGSSAKRPKMFVFYIRTKSPFPELEQFIQDCSRRYDFYVHSYYAGGMKEALSVMKHEHPEVECVLLGQRVHDPNSSSVQIRCKTDVDRGWPEYMRVHPMFNWRYRDVWSFLRTLFVPYCVLYDRGYTSLGWMEDSRPNPKLLRYDMKNVAHYKPAYELADSDDERGDR